KEKKETRSVTKGKERKRGRFHRKKGGNASRAFPESSAILADRPAPKRPWCHCSSSVEAPELQSLTWNHSFLWISPRSASSRAPFNNDFFPSFFFLFFS